MENTDGCTTQNLRVFKIEPKQVFTLDIANLRTDGTALEFGEELVSCVGGMVSASYDPAQENLVAYDYGTEYLFYAVTASGFSGSWQPEFELTGLTGTQSALIEWAYPATPAVWNAVNTPVTVQNQSGTVETSGECILVRVSLSHHSEEVLTAQQIQLAVDGTSGSLPDVHHADCSPDGFTHDRAVHTLKPRPAIQKL